MHAVSAGRRNHCENIRLRQIPIHSDDRQMAVFQRGRSGGFTKRPHHLDRPLDRVEPPDKKQKPRRLRDAVLLAKRGPRRHLTIQPRQIHRPVHNDNTFVGTAIRQPRRCLLQAPPGREHDPIGVGEERPAPCFEPEPLEQTAVGQPPGIEAAMRHRPIPPAVLPGPRSSPCCMAAK